MYFLIALIFISKISLQFIPGIPYESSNIIFQYGIHPYINIILCCAFGGFLILKRLLKLEIEHSQQLKLYSFYIFVISIYLLTITGLQILLLDSTESVILQFTACSMSVFMIYLFGKYLPTKMSAFAFIQMIQQYCVFLCWISLVFLFLSPRTSFMGGRFIGIFKHIPHMVSVATLAFVFSLYNLFCKNETKIQKIYLYLSLLCSFSMLVLTGTRSALASLAMATVLSFILFKAKSVSGQYIKASLMTFLILTGLLFGNDIANYAIQVSRGEKSVGYRAAQDGVSSRWDEVVRGYESFQEQPWLGYGLLAKFGQSEDGGVGSYNANKDPHNLLISAGVVGGWGFVVLIATGFVGLVILAISRLRSKNDAIKMLAIYMVTQLPIIFIYHIHVSMGGIADRIYWIVVGYLAISLKDD
jgi:hypothetical protein